MVSTFHFSFFTIRVTVQASSSMEFREPEQSIHLREKNIAGPTERPKNAKHFLRLAGKDLRFSMKMMFAPDSEVKSSPSELS